MPAFSYISRKKKAAKAAEAQALAEKQALGPGPSFPVSALQDESYQRAAGMVARSEYARRRARPVNAVTARLASGAQTGIRRPAKPGGY